MFEELEKINSRPKPFEFYTAGDLWTDEHTSKKMLSFHLNEDIDISSRRGEFIDRSVDWIVSRFHVGDGTAIADFGCGPGLYTSRLARRGADVTGIDFSQRSIEYARKVVSREQLKVHYENQNYLDYESEKRFDLVLMIFCDFCALSPVQRQRMLDKFYGILKPGGSVLLDVYSLSAFQKRQETTVYEQNLLDGFWSPNRYYGFLNTFKYDKEQVILDKYTIVESDRVRIIYNWLQYLKPQGLVKEFEGSGFRAEELYSDVAGAAFKEQADEFAVVARKK